MRAACDLYEHPQLTDSEIWAKDAYNKSGKNRVMAAAGALSVVALSGIAALQYAGVVNVTRLADPNTLLVDILGRAT